MSVIYRAPCCSILLRQWSHKFEVLIGQVMERSHLTRIYLQLNLWTQTMWFPCLDFSLIYKLKQWSLLTEQEEWKKKNLKLALKLWDLLAAWQESEFRKDLRTLSVTCVFWNDQKTFCSCCCPGKLFLSCLFVIEIYCSITSQGYASFEDQKLSKTSWSRKEAWEFCRVLHSIGHKILPVLQGEEQTRTSKGTSFLFLACHDSVNQRSWVFAICKTQSQLLPIINLLSITLNFEFLSDLHSHTQHRLVESYLNAPLPCSN